MLNFRGHSQGRGDWLEEITMESLRHKFSFFLGVLALVGLFGCKQESPADKAKEAASGNTAPVAGQAVIDAMKKPMDDARQTEGALQKSAEQTAGQANKATQ